MRTAPLSLTEGSILRGLIAFSVPLLIGNVFQQLYNTVDSIVVGNFVGRDALAAIGTVEPLINTFIGFFLGLSVGSTVVISQAFGAKDEQMVGRAVGTTIAGTAVLCVVFTAVSLLLLDPFLSVMKIPTDVWDDAHDYLSIYFAGVSGLLFYNMGAGILRAVGDSRRPLYYLLFSTTLNIALDLLFVAAFEMGTAGAAYATILAQAASAVLVLFVLARERSMFGIKRRYLRFDRPLLAEMLSIGLPGALQLTVTAFSNVFVQSYVNRFGASAMAGWSTYIKIDKTCLLPIQSIGLATTTFVGQNIGARQQARAREGVSTALRASFGVSLAVIAFVYLCAGPLVMLFNREPDVVEFGKFFVQVQMPFFIFVCFNQILASALRGAGDTKVPVVLMMISFILFRQAYLLIVSSLTDSIIPIALGYPLGWVTCTLLVSTYYRRRGLKR